MLEIREDNWLSKAFLCPVFRVNVLKDAKQGVFTTVDRDNFEAHKSLHRKGFYYTKIPVSDLDSVSFLEDLNFNLVETSLQYRADAGAAHKGKAGCGDSSNAGIICLKDLDKKHHDEILDIAATSFSFSRFHLDPRIDNAVADEIKRAWVDSYLNRLRGEDLLVAFSGEIPIGFLAVLLSGDEKTRMAVIDLMAVRKSFRCMGVGKKLVTEYFHKFRDECDFFQVGTQIANVSSNRFYVNCGFKLHHSYYVFHLHSGTGGGA